jgi:hypothetical protein
MTLLGPEAKVQLRPYPLKCDGRMENRKTAGSKDDHDTFEDHEERFVGGEEIPVETSGEFHATVDGSNENRDTGNEEGWRMD